MGTINTYLLPDAAIQIIEQICLLQIFSQLLLDLRLTKIIVVALVNLINH